MTALELDRRDTAKSLVTADRVVPALDKLEDRHARFGLRLETPAREQLAIERGEEALAHRVVVGIAHRFSRSSFTWRSSRRSLASSSRSALVSTSRRLPAS